MSVETCFGKLIEPKDLEKKVEELKESNKSIATLNGSFDLLHAGHLTIIKEASMQADVLIVALNSDASIKKYKSNYILSNSANTSQFVMHWQTSVPSKK